MKTPRSTGRSSRRSTPYSRTVMVLPASARRRLFATPRTVTRSVRRRRRGGRSQRLRPSEVGERVGSSNTKQVTDKQNGKLQGWKLYYQDMTNISRGTTLSQRQRDVVNCRGFMIDGYFRTITQTTGAGLPSDVYMLNVAVLAPEVPQATREVLGTDFFRAMDDGDKRTTDFATTLGTIDLHKLPINTDKFVVLKHKRYMMNTFGAQHKGWMKKIKWWIPLKRQLVYNSTAGTSCQSPVYFVYWCCRGFQTAQVDATIDFVDTQFRLTTFFRETPN